AARLDGGGHSVPAPLLGRRRAHRTRAGALTARAGALTARAGALTARAGARPLAGHRSADTGYSGRGSPKPRPTCHGRSTLPGIGRWLAMIRNHGRGGHPDVPLGPGVRVIEPIADVRTRAPFNYPRIRRHAVRH